MPQSELIQFLIDYKYQVLFPIAVLEGPIITVISGVLMASGHLEFLPTLLIVFAGDLISDSFFYSIGRTGRLALARLKFITIPEERLERLEKRYHSHTLKTFIVGKLSYGLTSVFMVAAGAAKLRYATFLRYIAGFNVIKSSLLLLVGYYYGKVVLSFSGYLRFYAFAVILVVPLGYYLASRLRNRRTLPQ